MAIVPVTLLCDWLRLTVIGNVAPDVKPTPWQNPAKLPSSAQFATDDVPVYAPWKFGTGSLALVGELLEHAAALDIIATRITASVVRRQAIRSSSLSAGGKINASHECAPFPRPSAFTPPTLKGRLRFA